MNDIKGRKKEKTGVVVGNEMKKTIKVMVERQIRHPLYKKVIKKRKVYFTHDEYEKCKIGDVVRIVETRPISKIKRWRVEEIIDLAPVDKTEQNEDRDDKK
jgi:small subunit ribosomal protein S17